MVSICIATYNGEKFIKDQLKSILCQINHNDEVIISDDGSTDNTIAEINTIKDIRIKLYFNKTKRGYTNNFENALLNAKGSIIFFSDQDDIWLPDKYSTMLRYLEDYDMVMSNSKVTDENLNILVDSFFDIYNSRPGLVKNIIFSTYYGSCMAFKRRILNYALPFPKNEEICFDIWIGLVSEVVGKVKFIPEPLILYRRSVSSLTSINSNKFTRSKRPIWRKLYKRVVHAYYLFLVFIKFKTTSNEH